jgi:MOSC domain-containing protein YiiM
MVIRLMEVRTGAVKSYEGPDGRAWKSAIGKEPVSGPTLLTRLGLQGDTVGNRQVHGGPDQAVLAYAGEHYAHWREEGLEAAPGSFGENFVLAGLTDQEACIGDVYDLGGAQVQVSHPRQPCETLARRLGRKDVVARVWATARGGWYLRVLREAPVEAGLALTLVRRPNPGATVARVLKAYLDGPSDRGEALAMAALEGLSPHWAEALEKKARG